MRALFATNNATSEEEKKEFFFFFTSSFQFLHVMRTCEPLFREFLFQQLGMLVAIVKQHIRVYLDAIFALVSANQEVLVAG